jgi:undecaprenyl diphosphate synthase
LMGLLRSYLRTETARLVRSGAQLIVIGRRDRLPDGLAEEIGKAEAATADGSRLQLRIAIDYSARAAILAAARRVGGEDGISPEAFARLVTGEPQPRDVDLLIRTSGEKRLSDFLLWESAYAELYFTDRMWPDFGPDDLAEALHSFRRRERRFGGLPSALSA